MNILTYFDQKKITDGWRERVAQVFSSVSDTTVIHVESLDDMFHRMDTRGSEAVVFGFSDGIGGSWMQIFPHVKEHHIPIILTGDLDKEQYKRIFRERTGHALETLDTVQFYTETPSLLQRIEERHARHMGERKE